MTDTLATDLLFDVIFGVYAPGARIVEGRVMEHYGVKRNAVRNAFFELESRGLLLSKPHRGVEVVDFTSTEIDALYDVRIVLETAAAERTPLPCDPLIADELENIARLHESAVKGQDLRSIFWLNQEFHEVQHNCCGNPKMAELIGSHALLAHAIGFAKYEHVKDMKFEVHQHFNIISALRGKSRSALVSAVRAHLPAPTEA